MPYPDKVFAHNVRTLVRRVGLKHAALSLGVSEDTTLRIGCESAVHDRTLGDAQANFSVRLLTAPIEEVEPVAQRRKRATLAELEALVVHHGSIKAAAAVYGTTGPRFSKRLHYFRRKLRTNTDYIALEKELGFGGARGRLGMSSVAFARALRLQRERAGQAPELESPKLAPTPAAEAFEARGFERVNRALAPVADEPEETQAERDEREFMELLDTRIGACGQCRSTDCELCTRFLALEFATGRR